MTTATPTTQPPTLQPFATWNPTSGVWETTQLDLSGQPAPFSAIWPTSGMTHAGSAYPLPASEHPTTATASSSPPGHGALFRTPLATDSTRGGETLDQVRARRGTIALSHQVIDLALNGPHGSRVRQNESETLWTLIETIFTTGEATPTPSPDGNTSPDEKPQPRRS